MRRTTLAVLGLAALAANAFAETRIVEVGSFFFRDTVSNTSTTTISPGDTVRWVWIDGFHSTRSLPSSAEQWDSGWLFWDPTAPVFFERTFNNPGSFPYECEIHSPHQSGVVIVSAPPTRTVTVNVGLTDFTGDQSSVMFMVSVNGGAPMMKHVTPLNGVGSGRGQFMLSLGVTPQTVRIVGAPFLAYKFQLPAGTNNVAVDASLFNGDSDESNMVDDADLTNIILDFGAAGGSASGFATDFDGNGTVDDADLTILILNFGFEGD